MNEVANPASESNWYPSIYEQLHQIAEQALRREAPGHSLQPTLLVNDAYLRLLEQRNVDPTDRSTVLAAGANIIRRLLVEYGSQAQSEEAWRNQGSRKRGCTFRLPLTPISWTYWS